MVDTMPSAVSGLTYAEAPCCGVTPSGKGTTSAAWSLRYWVYIPTSARAEQLRQVGRVDRSGLHPDDHLVGSRRCNVLLLEAEPQLSSRRDLRPQLERGDTHDSSATARPRSSSNSPAVPSPRSPALPISSPAFGPRRTSP